MKGAMLYVNAGKGHYVPAKALADKEIRLDKKKKQLVGLEEKTENDIRNDAFAIKDKAADLYEETIESVMERIYSGR